MFGTKLGQPSTAAQGDLVGESDRRMRGRETLDLALDFLESNSLKAALTCFWHGRRDAERPVIPPEIGRLFSLIPIGTEVDFERDEESPARRSHKAA